MCVVCTCVCISILKYAIGPSHSPSYSPVCTQNLLKLHNVIILICTDQTGHGFDLGIVLVGFGLGRSGHQCEWGRMWEGQDGGGAGWGKGRMGEGLDGGL